jgi:signal transduction histidine kinase
MSSGTVLVVDDIEANVEIFVMGLSAFGYTVYSALRARDALAKARDVQPDIILLDILMPEMNGYEVCQQLKADPLLQDVPVVFVSALHETVDKLRGFKVGAVDFLTKPLQVEEAFARIETHITLYRQKREIQGLLHAKMNAERIEREQRLLLNALLDNALTISSTLELDEVLERVLANVETVVPHDVAAVILLRDGQGELSRFYNRTSRPYDPPTVYPLEDFPIFHQMMETRQPVWISNTLQDPRWRVIEGTGWTLSYLGTPLVVDDTVIGFLDVLSADAGLYDTWHAHNLQSLSIYAGIAIRNARSYEQARELATLQERQRIARDLHDSVTQTLFSASSIIEAIPTLVEKKPDKIPSYWQKLTELIQGAQAEMRALLVELRSETFVQLEISQLLAQLCDAFTNRSGVKVIKELTPMSGLSLETKTAVYRIAQEALNNISKHARASTVLVELSARVGKLTLNVQDNGRGFDTKHTPENHFGLGIMRERAHTIGAKLSIASGVGVGTQVLLEVLLKERE